MKNTVIALGLAVVPLVGFAAPNDTPGAPSYSYFQGDWVVDGNAHGTGQDYDGYALEGSVAITPNVFVNGRYDWLDVDSSAFAANRTSIGVGAIALLLMIVFWKEFALRTFDPDHATVLGFAPRVIDTLMFTTIVIATVIGVKAVGLVLMVAFVVTPPAAARQWTRTLPGMVMVSAGIGAVGSGLGAYLSVALGRIPTGPLIVLTLFAIFVFSMLFSPRRSIVLRAIRRSRARADLKREIQREAAIR